jgi:hypothetical protein
METPSKDFSLTLSLSGFGGKRSLTLAPMAALRVAAALAVCALCYKFGTWQGRLEAQASHSPVVAVAAAAPAADPKHPEPGTSAPGDPYGQEAAVITPLNVRDPSALVMGPGLYSDPPSSAVPPAPGRPSRRAKPRKEGPRLIPDPGPHQGPDIRL